MLSRNRWKKGDWLVIDEESGLVEYASKIKKDWRGLYVHQRYADEQHPQDFIYALDDPKTLPFVSPPDRIFDVTSKYPIYVGNTSVLTVPFGAAYHIYQVTASVAPVTPPPDRSIDFESSSSQYMVMSTANFGVLNAKKWTYHVWFKRESNGNVWIASKRDSGVGFVIPMEILFDASNKIDIRIRDVTLSIIGRLVTNVAYTDTNWHQLIVYWDSNNGTSGDRLQLWVDQVRITSFSTNTQPSLDASMYDDSTTNFYIGANVGLANFYDGLLYEQAFFNNALPSASLLSNISSPVDLSTIPGLTSYWYTTASSVLEDDAVLTANWTNVNSVVKSTTVPA